MMLNQDCWPTVVCRKDGLPWSIDFLYRRAKTLLAVFTTGFIDRKQVLQGMNVVLIVTVEDSILLDCDARP